MAAAVSTALAPRAVERALAQIRERESSPSSAGARAALFTLVVFLPEHGGGGDPTALQFLRGRRPARIITIEASGTPPGASVGGRCSLDRRNRDVCSEEIAIARGADGSGTAPGTWGPLAIRDIPVCAWWLSDIGEIPSWLLDPVGPVDTLIVDSGGTGAAQPSGAGDAARLALGALCRLHRRTGGAPRIADLAWRRGATLRETAARAFDPADQRAALPLIRTAHLEGGEEIDALYLFAWLAARLSWPLDGWEEGLPQFHGPEGGEIRVSHSRPAGLSRGFRLRFSFDGGAVLTAGCSADGCISCGGRQEARWIPGPGEILLAVLDAPGRDALFEETLMQIEAIVHAEAPRG